MASKWSSMYCIRYNYKDVKITDLVKQLSIEDGTTIWKNEILKHNNEVDVETRSHII